MSVASFIASQRTEHRVPHAKCCRWLGVSASRGSTSGTTVQPTARQQRRAELDAAVKASFDDSGGTPGTYGSPRVFEDLVEAGWKVSVNTVAASMARQGLQGRSPKRKRRCLTRPDKAADADPGPGAAGTSAPSAIDQRWCGDLTEIPTDEGKLYLATVLDLGVAAAAGLRHGRASRLGAGQGGAVHGRRGARRRRRRRDLPHRQGRRVRRRPVRPGLQLRSG